MGTKRKTTAVVFALLAIAAGIAIIALLQGDKTVQRLSDGTVLALTDVKIGQNVEFTEGSSLERILGKHIPAKGLKIGRFTLRQPTKMPAKSFFSFADEPRLFLQFKLTGTPAQIAASDFLANPPRIFRLVLTGDDGFEFVQPFFPQFSRSTGGYGYSQPFYPRQSKTLFLRIEKLDARGGPCRTIARFTTHITPEPVRPMTPENLPIRRSIQGLDFTLNEVSVYKNSPPWSDYYNYSAEMAFQVLENGQPQTNLWAFPINAQDAGGNSLQMGGFTQPTNGMIVLTNLRPLDPRKPWRVRMNFGRKSDFPATNLVTFDFTVPNFNSATPIQTNLLGVPVKIDFDELPDSLEVTLTTNCTDLRVTIVNVEGPDGKQIGTGQGWLNERDTAWMLSTNVLNANLIGTRLHVTLAIHPNYQMEFIVQPLDKYSGRTGNYTNSQ